MCECVFCKIIKKESPAHIVYENEKGIIMIIKTLSKDFSVCKVVNYSEVDLTKEYVFIGKTDEENSLVCVTDSVPENVIERDDGWKAFKMH